MKTYNPKFKNKLNFGFISRLRSDVTDISYVELDQTFKNRQKQQNKRQIVQVPKS
jgi:hypothetical protein